MVDYIKIRNLPTHGKTVAEESPVYQSMLVLLRELVQPIFAELGQEVTIEVTLKITPRPNINCY